MPNRMLRDWTNSDKINSLDPQSERFFTRLIMKVDDYGCFYADTRLLKANLFPLLLDNIREADLLRWTAACQKAGLIVLYENANKRYLQIQDFRQRLDKAKSKYPLPQKSDFPEVVNEFRAEPELEPEIEKKKKIEPEKPEGPGETNVSPTDDRKAFAVSAKDKKSICDFIKTKKPDFIEPYAELWNLFAKEKNMAKVSKLNNTRKRKFKSRIDEESFDFLEILKKAAQSEFLLAHKWFGFDWIIENESNYLKIIEGSYDKDNKKVKTNQPVTDLQYLFERFCEGDLDKKMIAPQHYEQLHKKGDVSIDHRIITMRMESLSGGNKFSDTELYKDYEAGRSTKLTEEDKPVLMRLAVLEYFKKIKTKKLAIV